MGATLARAMSDLGWTALGLSIALHAAWCAWLVARRAFAGSGSAARACAWFVALVWLSSAMFFALVELGCFRLLPASIAWAVLAFVLARTLDPERFALHELGSDLARARSRAHEILRSRAAWAVLPLGAFLLAGWARASVAPPLGWDALTYHLVKAARWTQGAGLYLDDGPDAWGYYRWFAWLGDAPWSWSLLALRSDLGLASINLLVVVALVITTRTLARELGADEVVAWFAAAALALVPAVQRFWFTDYVENLLLACWLCALLFALRAWRARRKEDAAFALAAFALAAGIKLPGLALALVGATPIAIATLRGAFGPRWRAAACAVAIALPGAIHYALVAWHTGSPLHPHRLALAGRVIAPGNAELADVLHGREPAPLGPFLDGLLGAHLSNAGFGPAGTLLMVGGLLALALELWRGSRRAWALLLVASALVVAVPIFGPDVAALRSRWGPVTGRFLAPAFAALLLGALSLPRRAALALFAFALLQDVGLAWPRGWIELDARMLGLFVVSVLPLLACAVGLVWRRPPLGTRACAAFVLVAVSTLPWRALSAGSRAEYYAQARVGRAFEAHPLTAECHDLWSALDGQPAQRIAITAGFEYPGHNWLVYPFFGSRLQHTVEYVPVTADGSIVDHRERERLLATGDERAWLTRLVEREIDVVVTLRPRNTLEDGWIGAHPELFAELARAHRSVAWRFDREAARAWLAAQ